MSHAGEAMSVMKRPPRECLWDGHGNMFCFERIGDGRATKLRHIA